MKATTLTITVALDGAAFEDNGLHDELQMIISQIHSTGFEPPHTMRLRDSNGNTVGEARYD